MGCQTLNITLVEELTGLEKVCISLLPLASLGLYIIQKKASLVRLGPGGAKAVVVQVG